MPKKVKIPSPSHPHLGVPRELEFRCSSDDAWYAVSLRFENGDNDKYLRVKYKGYDDNIHDEIYRIGDFQDVDGLQTFENRFRFSSIQLQDSECWKIKKGMEICGCCKIDGGNELKYFDAVVRSVSFFSLVSFFISETLVNFHYIRRYDHDFPNTDEDEEEEEDQVCTCVFNILWQHGPFSENMASSRIENICLIQEERKNLDPALTMFLDLARHKILCTQALTVYSSDIQMIGILDEDFDLGTANISSEAADSTETYYSVFIENLEIDTSPKNIVDFVFQQTSVWSQALIFPCSFSDIYQRGVIIVEAGHMIMKIINFLQDPSHIIVSSRGRPWVMPKKRWHCNSLRNVLPTNNTLRHHLSQPHLNPDALTGIMVVQEGSDEFERAKRLTDMFLEFYNHVSALLRSLASEERKLLAT